MIWVATSSAVVGQLGFLKSIVNADISQEILEHFMFSYANKLYDKLWFHYPAGRGTCPHCQTFHMPIHWPWYYCAWLVSKLVWPESHRDSMKYSWEEDEWSQTATTTTMTWGQQSRQCWPPEHTDWLFNATLLQCIYFSSILFNIQYSERLWVLIICKPWSLKLQEIHAGNIWLRM